MPFGGFGGLRERMQEAGGFTGMGGGRGGFMGPISQPSQGRMIGAPIQQGPSAQPMGGGGMELAQGSFRKAMGGGGGGGNFAPPPPMAQSWNRSGIPYSGGNAFRSAPGMTGRPDFDIPLGRSQRSFQNATGKKSNPFQNASSVRMDFNHPMQQKVFEALGDRLPPERQIPQKRNRRMGMF